MTTQELVAVSTMPVVAKAKPLTASEVKANVQIIQEVLKEVMLEKTHYDVIPGTGGKPSLLKPGAEKILTTFRIACMPEVIDLSSDDEIRYRIIAKGVHQTSGIVVGAGVGECSSNEDKYKWRAVICQEEWEITPQARRREKWNKGYQNKPAYAVKQVRTNPSDIANTILKMAKKRAMVDLTLTATAASDVFAQDIEDAPQGMVNNGSPTNELDVSPALSKISYCKDMSELQKLFKELSSFRKYPNAFKAIVLAKDAKKKELSQ